MKESIKKGGALFVLAVFGLSLLCGCRREEVVSQPEESVQESREESQESVTTPAETPQEGGELAMAVVLPDTFNPLLCGEESARQMMNLIFTPLVELDAQGNALPAIAKEWSLNGNVLTLQIDTSIRYHDGTTVTASDVVYSVETIQQAEESAYKENVAAIQKLQATASDTVVITFLSEEVAELDKLRIPILSQAYYSKEELTTLPMGSGPYQVAGYLRGRELQLVRFDSYYGEKPYITNITVSLTHVEESAEAAFEQGLTDIYVPGETTWGLYDNRDGLTLHSYDSREVLRAIFNTQSESLTTAAMRCGLALCIDSGTLLKDIYRGHGTLCEDQAWPESSVTQLMAYDPTEGRRLLGTAAASTLRLAVDASDALTVSCAKMLAGELEQLGLAIEVCEFEAESDWQSEAWDLSLVRQAEGVQQELPSYSLFAIDEAVMTGKSVGGTLTPTAWNWYRGIEALYIK